MRPRWVLTTLNLALIPIAVGSGCELESRCVADCAVEESSGDPSGSASSDATSAGGGTTGTTSTSTTSTSTTSTSTTAADTSESSASVGSTGDSDSDSTGADDDDGADEQDSGDGGDGADEQESGGDEENNCGNGVLDPGEECDDGNRDNLDGCTQICTSTEGVLAEFNIDHSPYYLDEFTLLTHPDQDQSFLWHGFEDELYISRHDIHGRRLWEHGVSVGEDGDIHIGETQGAIKVGANGATYVVLNESPDDRVRGHREGDERYIGRLTIISAEGEMITENKRLDDSGLVSKLVLGGVDTNGDLEVVSVGEDDWFSGNWFLWSARYSDHGELLSTSRTALDLSDHPADDDRIKWANRGPKTLTVSLGDESSALFLGLQGDGDLAWASRVPDLLPLRYREIHPQELPDGTWLLWGEDGSATHTIPVQYAVRHLDRGGQFNTGLTFQLMETEATPVAVLPLQGGGYMVGGSYRTSDRIDVPVLWRFSATGDLLSSRPVAHDGESGKVWSMIMAGPRTIDLVWGGYNSQDHEDFTRAVRLTIDG